jgi:hypothetical protein
MSQLTGAPRAVALTRQPARDTGILAGVLRFDPVMAGARRQIHKLFQE